MWLCRPGIAPDPCTGDLDATVVSADGRRRVTVTRADPGTGFDCFYVYPTVSTEAGTNSDLRVQPAETRAAMAQAQRFSQVCRVWAPMYRQITVSDLAQPSRIGPAALDTAYESVLSAWRSYLAEDNGGRPVIFIGHSQGASMLIRLLESQIDPDPALRARTVLAIILGGNVVVPTGGSIGGTFTHLPLCSQAVADRCLIAYSSFPSEPPATALFGRPGRGVSLFSGQTATKGLSVACVDPARYGGTGALQPYIPSSSAGLGPPAVRTPWVTYPGLYEAQCRSAGGASWLNVSTLVRGGRPTVSEVLGPEWGYHVDDINLALGNLVYDTALAEAVWTRSHPPAKTPAAPISSAAAAFTLSR